MPRPMDRAQQPQLGGGCTPDPWEGSLCFLLSLAEAVVLNMEAGGMVKLLLPAQVSSKRRAGGWERCWTWQNQRAGDIMLSGDGAAGAGAVRTWRMEDGRLSREGCTNGTLGCLARGRKGQGSQGTLKAGPSAGWMEGRSPQRRNPPLAGVQAATPGAIRSSREWVSQERRRSRHQADGSGASRDGMGAAAWEGAGRPVGTERTTEGVWAGSTFVL